MPAANFCERKREREREIGGERGGRGVRERERESEWERESVRGGAQLSLLEWEKERVTSLLNFNTETEGREAIER